jgi:hypothetical protein
MKLIHGSIIIIGWIKFRKGICNHCNFNKNNIINDDDDDDGQIHTQAFTWSE